MIEVYEKTKNAIRQYRSYKSKLQADRVNSLLMRFSLLLLAVSMLMYVSGGVRAYENRGNFTNKDMNDIAGGAHRIINDLALEVFFEKARMDPIMSSYDFQPTVDTYRVKKLNTLVLDEYEKALFKPEGQAAFKRVLHGTDKNSMQKDMKFGFREWVIEGGFSADEPEYYMSLRHFFNPVEGKGESYLTDLPAGYSTRMGLKETNPNVNAKDWVISHQDNQFNWTKSTERINEAFGLPQYISEPMGNYASSWRGLGEAMHLVADMTVPAHVRNDSHPAAGAWLMDDLRADAYEYIVALDTSIIYNSMKTALISEDMLKGINEAKKLEDLFNLIAVHVNRNFFSADTIPYDNLFGYGYRTDCNGAEVFDAPLLENCTHDTEIGDYYIEDFVGERLIMAHDTWVNDNGWNTVPPDTTKASVESQARRLIPIAVHGCAKVADLFMPRVKIAVDSIDLKNLILKGNLGFYEKDEQGSYSMLSAKHLNSRQKIIVFFHLTFPDGTKQVLARLAPPVEVKDGKFEISLKGTTNEDNLFDYLNPEDGVDPEKLPRINCSLGLDMGGILVRSPEPVIEGLSGINMGNVVLSVYPILAIDTSVTLNTNANDSAAQMYFTASIPVLNGNLKEMMEKNTLPEFQWDNNTFHVTTSLKDEMADISIDVTCTARMDGSMIESLKVAQIGYITTSEYDAANSKNVIVKYHFERSFELIDIPAVDLSVMGATQADLDMMKEKGLKAFIFQVKGADAASHVLNYRLLLEGTVEDGRYINLNSTGLNWDWNKDASGIMISLSKIDLAQLESLQ